MDDLVVQITDEARGLRPPTGAGQQRWPHDPRSWTSQRSPAHQPSWQSEDRARGSGLSQGKGEERSKERQET
jgi:hypothetical protein